MKAFKLERRGYRVTGIDEESYFAIKIYRGGFCEYITNLYKNDIKTCESVQDKIDGMIDELKFKFELEKWGRS